MRAIVMACGLTLAAAAATSAQVGEIFEKRVVGGAVGATIEFVAGEPALAAVVKGAPYSAEATTTVSQTLADGTRIERTTVARLYRDGEGRVRREQTVLGLDPLSGAEAPSLITISDPVAGVSYVLDSAMHRAHRTSFGRLTFKTGGMATVKDGAMFTAEAGVRRIGPPPPPPAPGSGEPARQVTGMPPPPPPPPPPPAGESIGVRQIEGLEAVGTRMTAVIETGRIGNDRPIEIVDERWESRALKIVLHSKHSDPRTGIVEYRLTNVSRAEPPRELFTVPSDYVLMDAKDEQR